MLKTKIPSYFNERRKTLIEKYPGSVFFFPAPRRYLRNPDVYHPFRQESNFYYLTGFDESDSFLVIYVPYTGAAKTALFVQKRNPDKEIWDGEIYGKDRVKTIFQADEVYHIEELEEKLPDFLFEVKKVYYRFGQDFEVDFLIRNAFAKAQRKRGRTGEGTLPMEDPVFPLGEMRLFKRPEEIEIMRKVTQLAAEAHCEVMKKAKPKMMEYQVAGLFEYAVKNDGCERLAYDSIVAAGKNATCLHYTRLNEELKENDLLLIDAGGEKDHYASDITRTFPISARFSESQARIYDIVLKSQKEAIAMVRPGVKLVDLHQKAINVLFEGLRDLKLLETKEEIKRFYPHNTSHWLGMDVHDVGLYKINNQDRILEKGMVFTVEPGLYFQASDTSVPEEYRNIGIRIEDDILVTDQGCEVLSCAAPKERDDIEALRK